MTGPSWIVSDMQESPRSPDGVLLCGACRAKAACRLGVRQEFLDDNGIGQFDVSCPRDQEGGPDVAHGGWTAAVMDECLGHMPPMMAQMSVTATLAVNFKKPVPVERPLVIRAWIDKIEGSRWFITGELVLLPSGSVLATANGIWIARDPTKHFAQHQLWLAEQDALARSAPGDEG